MLNQIRGLHHVTSLASSPARNNAFFTELLGLRRVKKTVNFDAPSIYHLYYGNAQGTPGTVMTYFPFPHAVRGKRGTGEVGTTAFSIPKGAAAAWAQRLTERGVAAIGQDRSFGAARLTFEGPDGDGFALIEVENDRRIPWAEAVDEDIAIRGFHSVSLRLAHPKAEAELLRFMGYQEAGREGDVTRYLIDGGNGAHVIDIEARPGLPLAKQGAGSVHHIAFAVETRARQLEVREALLDTGYQVTPVIDRNYFWAIYFRTPGGVLFEVATNEPGFGHDEDTAHLGEALRLPAQHEHLRRQLERTLEPL